MRAFPLRPFSLASSWLRWPFVESLQLQKIFLLTYYHNSDLTLLTYVLRKYCVFETGYLWRPFAVGTHWEHILISGKQTWGLFSPDLKVLAFLLSWNDHPQAFQGLKGTSCRHQLIIGTQCWITEGHGPASAVIDLGWERTNATGDKCCRWISTAQYYEYKSLMQTAVGCRTIKVLPTAQEEVTTRCDTILTLPAATSVCEDATSQQTSAISGVSSRERSDSYT